MGNGLPDMTVKQRDGVELLESCEKRSSVKGKRFIYE